MLVRPFQGSEHVGGGCHSACRQRVRVLFTLSDKHLALPHNVGQPVGNTRCLTDAVVVAVVGPALANRKRLGSVADDLE